MGKPIGLVLAGGAGRRLGRSKGELELRGRTLAEIAAGRLSPLCRAVRISIRPGERNPAPGHEPVEDSPPAGRGPLAGIDAAFREETGSDLLVLACDYPRVGSRLLARLLSSATAADELTFVVGADGRDHPLVGLWRAGVAQRVVDALDRGRLAVRELVARSAVRRVAAADDDELLNLNRPEDLEAL